MSQPYECLHNDIMVLIALGSNATSSFGAPFETLCAAISAISHANLDLLATSRFFATPCVPTGTGPDYVNAVICGQTRLDAPALLALLHEIEADFDRKRSSRWASRTLDLDLIDFGGQVWPDAETHAVWRALPFERQRSETPTTLLLPHPRVQDRAFVLMPLADIAPDWVHPLVQRSTLQMLKDLPESETEGISVVSPPLLLPRGGAM